MPIGKNALKRVTNNGYSAVNASAPDMENSEILEEKSLEKAEKPTAKKTAKKAEPKSAPKKSETAKAKVETAEAKIESVSAKAEPKKNTAPKTEKPKVEKPALTAVKEDSHPDGFVKVSCGMDMPVYLL